MTPRPQPRFFGSPEALRTMIAGQERAARASSAAAAVLTADEAFDAAQDLWLHCSSRLQDPPDAVRLREVAQAREAWKKLKERFTR
ncbi:MAG: hypothetical protein QM820_06875 [Minicystis sp.]